MQSLIMKYFSPPIQFICKVKRILNELFVKVEQKPVTTTLKRNCVAEAVNVLFAFDTGMLKANNLMRVEVYFST